jgi:hypothetical protein
MRKLTKKQKREFRWKVALLLIPFIGGVYVQNYFVIPPVSIVSPVAAGSVEAREEIPTPTPKPTSEQEKIEKEIKEVFGEHAEKAFLLLKGKGPGTCRENYELNPKAVGRNLVKGQPGVYSSSDYGVFQINDKWQGVTNTRFLFDYKINIRMAWRIYEDNGYSFKLWTCGKAYGI